MHGNAVRHVSHTMLMLARSNGLFVLLFKSPKMFHWKYGGGGIGKLINNGTQRDSEVYLGSRK